MKMLELSDVVKAKERIDAYIRATPILLSNTLNKWLGHEVFFKAECYQKIGAFKARGGCNAIAWLREQKINPKEIIANSSGNHAQAVAWAAKQFEIPVTIFMPENASRVKIQATKSYGAKVVLCKTRHEADEQVKQASMEKGNYWIHPFNHEQVIAGQGTAAFESLKELEQVDAVFAPCGGGGLLSGTLIATRALSPKAQVIGGEPLNANDAAESLRKKSIQRLAETPTTLADGAMTMAVGDLTFEYLKQLDDLYEIDETQIVYWTQWLCHLLKVSVEPTSALAMGAAKKWLDQQSGKKKVLIILSGGNIDQIMMKKIWETDHLSDLSGLYNAS